MSGALMICGTNSHAGKSVVTAGLCRVLRRRGVSVAPFKAQNMSLNSVVAPDGAEIGRAQAMQAAAAGVEPKAAMNPVLLKPSGERRSQVIVMGRARFEADAGSYQGLKASLRQPVLEAFASLRARHDAVICEGAGSPAEINLRADDIANLGLARSAGIPAIVVGDIDRGGTLAALYGTLALLDPEDQRLFAGFLVNKFRGDAEILRPGLERLRELTGRPTFGILPWRDGLRVDAEDGVALEGSEAEGSPPLGADGIEVAVVRLRRISNFTDLDALALEPGVSVRFTRSAGEIRRADLVVVPGTKTTVADLALLRELGLDRALAERAAAGSPILGVCGGYQMLGTEIVDEVESRRGRTAGLGLLPVRTTFARDKLLRRVRGTLAGAPATGYEIRHGRLHRDGGEPLLEPDEGCIAGETLGTSWHGLLEGDAARRALLARVAARRGRDWRPGTRAWADVREAHLDRLGDWFAEHVDGDALLELIERGAPAGLPVIGPGGAACPV
jgi:adenosylcobyric acid synthase